MISKRKFPDGGTEYTIKFSAKDLIIGASLAVAVGYISEANSQWYNSIDQQQQNAQMMIMQQQILREQAAQQQMMLMQQQAQREQQQRNQTYITNQPGHSILPNPYRRY